ncbi:MAG: galactose mutarotase [Oceanospirillaceae bacterium]|jgi:aldose 1-epimerase|nr:galactose mutarotase [Oceanospirillaceae bacterium]
MNVQPCAIAPDGSDIFSVTIGDHLLQATVISFGGCLQDLRLKNFDYPLVLGYADVADYIGNASYLGAVVGRNANRIAHGRCSISGQKFYLTKAGNDQHQLHGGPKGSSFRNWQLVSLKTNQVVLQDRLPHGHMGYPGNLDVQITYTVEHNALDVKIEARTDQATLCNFTLHNYFNLDNSLTLNDHFLSVAAASYLPTDVGGIPLGNKASVDNTEYDYRQLKGLHNLALKPSLDHNFCITDLPGKLRPIARLQSSISGVGMQLFSSEAGLQVYNGVHVSVNARQALHGRAYGAYSGLALEPQGWPNAANEGAFPSVVLHPKQVYSQYTRYHFDTEQDASLAV